MWDVYTGIIRCNRKFHWPNPLAEHERLFLVVCAADSVAEVSLNGNLLGKHHGSFDPFEFDITTLIQLNNHLTIDITGERGLWGTVFLEVRHQSYLRDLTIETLWNGPIPRLSLSGSLLGPVGSSLECDLIMDNTLISTNLVETSPEGLPIQFEVELFDVKLWEPSGFGNPTLHELRVELLDRHSRIFVHSRSFGVRSVKLLPGQKQVAVNTHLCPWPVTWILNEPVLESDTLEMADQTGKLLIVGLPSQSSPSELNVLKPHLFSHPSVVHVAETPC